MNRIILIELSLEFLKKSKLLYIEVKIGRDTLKYRENESKQLEINYFIAITSQALIITQESNPSSYL